MTTINKYGSERKEKGQNLEITREATVADIVIVGVGIVGLTTSLGLHRLGILSLVLESSGTLRVTGFALTIWTKGRSVVRGFVEFSSNHGMEHKFMQFLRKGFRAGVIPSDDKRIYWFFSWSPTSQGECLAASQGCLLNQE